MKYILGFAKKHFVFALVIALSFIFFYLKSIGYANIPDNTILDEKDYALSGYSFRKTLIPVGWSNMTTYRELSKQKDRGGLNKIDFSDNGVNLSINNVNPSLSNKNYFKYPLAWTTEIDVGKGKEHISLVQPFFDHPPLGGLIISLKSKNVASFSQISSVDYRQIAIIISFITGILIYFAGHLLINRWVGLISFIIYSTAPIFVLSSRYALLENILIPLFLISVILNFLYQQKNKAVYLFAIGIVCGLSFLVKESGIFILIFSLITNLKHKTKTKEYFKLIIPFFLIIGTYFAYSFYLSPELTIQLLFAQSQRNFYGPLSLISAIFQPGFNKFPIEGYWIFGFISLFVILVKNNPKYDFIKYSFISYSLIFLLQGSLNYPWYTLPFVPIIVISSGIFIYNTITENRFYQKMIIFLIPVSSSFFWGYMIQHQQNQVNIYRLLIIFALVIAFIKNKKVTLVLLIIIFISCIKLNYQSVQYLVGNWQNIPSQYQIKTYE